MRDGGEPEVSHQVADRGPVDRPASPRGNTSRCRSPSAPQDVNKIGNGTWRAAARTSDRLGAERHPVLDARLHAVWRRDPECGVGVDLWPGGAAYLAASGRCEYEERNASFRPTRAVPRSTASLRDRGLAAHSQVAFSSP